LKKSLLDRSVAQDGVKPPEIKLKHYKSQDFEHPNEAKRQREGFFNTLVPGVKIALATA
jgi:hypothetical protein